MQSTRHKTWCKQLHVCKDPNREEEEEIGLSDNDARYKAQAWWMSWFYNASVIMLFNVL